MKPALRLVSAPHAVSGAVPPHALEAEAAVIDAVITRPELAPRMVALVSEEYLYSPAHRVVWRAIAALTEAGTPLDLVTIADWLRARGDWDRAGRATGLAEFLDASPATGNWEAHVRLVRDRYARRRVIATAQTIAAEGYGDVGDERQWCQQAGERMRTVATEIAAARDTSMMAAVLDAAPIADGSASAAVAVECPTGIATLDGDPGCTYGYHAGELWIITAETGHGKTALACNTSTLACVDAGRGVGIQSAEMPRGQLALRMACSRGRVSFGRVRSHSICDVEYSRMITALAGLAKAPIEIDDRKRPSIEVIEANAMAWAEKFARLGTPLGILVVDHLGKLDLESLRKTRDEIDASLMERATERLIGLAERTKCAVVLLAQLNDSGKIRGSRGPGHDAHWRLEIERDAKHGTQRWGGVDYEPEHVHIVVKKARHGQNGSRCEAWFHGPFVTFSNDSRRIAPGEYADV